MTPNNSPLNLAAQRSYWQSRLQKPFPTLDALLDHPRPPMQSFLSAKETATLQNELYGQLQALARQQNVSLFTILLAGFKALLWRYTGQEDIIIGSLAASRQADAPHTFTNPIPLRTRLSDELDGPALLAQVEQTIAHSAANRNFPFDQLVDALDADQDLSRAPIFQLMLILLNAPTGLSGAPLAANDLQQADEHTARCDLTLIAAPAGDSLTLTAQYDSALFEPDTIRRLLTHFQMLLAGLAQEISRPISALPLITPAERQQILFDWNDTQTGLPAGETAAHQIFERRAGQQPAAIAAMYGGQQLTYAALNRRANRLAHALKSHGVGRDVIVALLAERSLDFLTAMLAIFKAGAAYLPLDPRNPDSRRMQVLRQSGASLLLTSQTYAAQMSATISQSPPEQQPQSLQIEALLAQDWPEDNLDSPVLPQDLAYVIYTSGSTGIPKGAMVEHRGMLNHLYAKIFDLNLTGADCVAQNAPQSFDISVWQFLSALLVGGQVVIYGGEIAHDPTQLLARIEQDQVSILETVPALLGTIIEEINRRPNPPQLPALRWLIPTGEALPPELCRQWLAIYPNIPLLNAYGPTECSDDVTHYAIHKPPPPEMAITPIGRPVANTQLYILSAHLQPLAVGVIGELYVGGVGVGRGYLRDPERTAQIFIPDPFGPQPGGRLYRTGDLARYLPDGNIEFLGRIDHQVKIRGFRIELGEVETALRRHSAAQEVVAVAHQDASGAKRLVAYVVPQTGVEAPEKLPQSWRAFLRAELPDYMVPSAFILLDALPLTPNGKIDRQALPEPEFSRPQSGEDIALPRTQPEKELAQIWADLLNLEQVGRHDNFFELGGDSIIGIQVAIRAKRVGLNLAPHMFFEYPTIAELVAAAAAEDASSAPAEQGLVAGRMPLTPIQHWFFEQDLPDPHHWNQAMLLKAKEPLDIERLEQALQHLLTHHDALRLRFARAEGGWQQVNADPGPPPAVTRIDLSTLDATAHTQAITAAAGDAQTTLNLAEGPLVRVVHFKLNAEQPERLLIVIHHLAVDTVSWQILLADLCAAYQQLGRGEPVQLPPKTTAYQQWAEQLVQYAQSEAVTATLDEWLAGPWDKIKPLPVDKPDTRARNLRASSAVVSVELEADETRALLQDIHAAYRTQINDILLAALAQAMIEWRKEHTTTPLLLDFERHGREEKIVNADLSRTVGWFTAIFPALLELNNVAKPGSAIKSIKEQLRQIPGRGLSYGLLRYLSQTPSGQKLQELPQAEIAFNYLGQFDQRLPDDSPFTLADESAGPNHSPRGARRYLLEIEGRVINGCLKLDWIYSLNIHRPESIEKLAHQYIAALRGLIDHCQSVEPGGYTPSDFPEADLSQQELDDLLEELGDL